jgi:hypothetical protein
MRDSYVEYIHKNNAEGSNRAGSYVRALDQLGAALKFAAVDQFHIADIWDIADAEFIDELRDYVIEQQKEDGGGIFKGTENSSYWMNRFYSASLKSYAEFLRAHGDSKMGIGSLEAKLREGVDQFIEFGLFGRNRCLSMVSGLMAKRFLIFTGLSGSGKTLQSLTFSKWMTPKETTGDVFAPGAKIPSANKVYLVKKSDSLSVEFWNSESSEQAVKVSLPREIITEWADYIRENGIQEDTAARLIREAVKKKSRFSDQLHSFETHLKAAAFALLKAEEISAVRRNYEIISVGADWTSNENLLGYPDALKEKSYRKPDNGALDLILRARADEQNPYFLILDEMNLSHVERYFADFLSAMESGEAISLHDDTGEDWNGVPAKLTIPKNLFVIGTVNVDETTYMFSPKVLDRANVIEFRISDDEMRSFLANPAKPNLDAIAGDGVQYAKAFVAAAIQKDVELESQLREQVANVLMKFFPALKAAGAEFGYRTAHEISRFVYFHKDLSSDGWKIEAAMDAAILQKLLPKLHGSKKKLGPVLAALIRLCLKEDACPEAVPIKDEALVAENAVYPGALEKLVRMRKRLIEHGFTSFAEA